MGVRENLDRLRSVIERYAGARLVAVSKTHAAARVREAYDVGQRVFGESRPQELARKASELPSDVEWHFIGHLQRNKVPDVVGVARLIHSVDSRRLLDELRRCADARGTPVDVLLQVRIAREETKFGLTEEALHALLAGLHDASSWAPGGRLRVHGLMGMATFTDDRDVVRAEFRGLRRLFERLRAGTLPPDVEMRELSMGMSGDFETALDEGSTLVRVGTAIFGERPPPAA